MNKMSKEKKKCSKHAITHKQKYVGAHKKDLK